MRRTAFRAAALTAGAGALVFFLTADLGIPAPANRALAVTALMAVWWMTEALPIHWTALAPIVLFPILGVPKKDLLDSAAVIGPKYFDLFLFVFLGGMFLSAAMERHDLHKRIALTIMAAVGRTPRRLLLGFVLATAFVSLWISNTATAVMMLPIGLAVIAELERREGRRLEGFGQAVMLSIAYAANVGGIGTKIGTAPNVFFSRFVETHLEGQPMDFLTYLVIGLPFVALFLPVVFAVLAFSARRDVLTRYSHDVVRAEKAKLGGMKPGERGVLGCFVLAAALWILGPPISELTQLREQHDALVAMGVSLLLFVTGLIRADAVKKLPWDALLVLGGSLALAEGIQASGLARWAGSQLAAVREYPLPAVMLVVTTATVLTSAFTSNMSTTAIMLTVVYGMTRGTQLEALPLLAGVCLAASCDFMLPAGTPPNAIVFGSKYVRLREMVRIGFMLDLLAAGAVALWCYLGVQNLL